MQEFVFELPDSTKVHQLSGQLQNSVDYFMKVYLYTYPHDIGFIFMSNTAFCVDYAKFEHAKPKPQIQIRNPYDILML